MRAGRIQNPHFDSSPFFFEGGPSGVLLLHGFTATPVEVKLIGQYLHESGYTVSGPLLPGHGTTVEDMNRCRGTDWTGHVEGALADLQARCETVFVGGLSMGTLLSLCLAAHHPELSGAILYSPALRVADRRIYLTPFLKHLVRKQPKSGKSDLSDPQAGLRLWSHEENPVPAAHELLKLIRQVRQLLPRVTCPVLVIHSTLDQYIHPTSAQCTYERVGSTDKELITLHNSGHCITVDSEWTFVAQKTYDFTQAHR